MAGYVSLTSQRALDITLPELEEQREIGRIVGALDDKIELNRRMGATLEGMARALYRSWFVDFDPVRARMEGRAPAHMAPATAALFPDRLDEDGLPEGWEMGTIGDVAGIVGGSTPSTKQDQFWGGKHFWATPRDLSRQGRSLLFETERRLTDVGLAKISSGLNPAGSVLLSSRAPIGYVAIAEVPLAVNQGFIVLRQTDQMSAAEAFCWLHENMEAIKGNANGSTFQEISKKNFRPLPCIVAPEGVRASFSSLVGPLLSRMKVALREADTLAAVRNALLPRLMSGELRVPEAEETVAAAF